MIEEADDELRIKGRGISKGKAEGTVIKSLKPISLADDVNLDTSEILDKENEIFGEPIKDRVFVLPYFVGSKENLDVISRLKENNVQPLALVAESVDEYLQGDAEKAELPTVDDIDTSLLETGDDVTVNGTGGIVSLRNVTLKHIATSVLLYQGNVLVLKRSDEVGTYKGRWACVSGYVEKEETADETAMRELSEELGLEREDYEFKWKGEALYARDKTMLWALHPFLFETEKHEFKLDWEHEEYRWILPNELKNYQTVPKLKETIESVLMRK
jgi:predicted aconitase with swiveling domain